jgi:hypothetical protein
VNLGDNEPGWVGRGVWKCGVGQKEGEGDVWSWRGRRAGRYVGAGQEEV